MIVEGNYIDFNLSANKIAELIDNSIKEVVLKPSANSHSGAGVIPFKKDNGVFTHNNEILTGDFLNKYGDNFVVQEVIQQHPYLSQFCRSSCNTMRIMTYRSLIDESVTVFGAVLRFGNEGSFVDNIFAGGRFVVIDVESGKLGSCCFDEFGRPYESANEVNFSQNEYVLPFWEQAKEFSTNIAKQISHHRLLAQDIVIDKNGEPRLIEFNIDRFNWSLTMYAGKIPFDSKFNEVIEYCKNKIK